MQAPLVFCSYSHDSPEHKEWVHAFASDLVLNGVDVILDQWDLKPGQDVVAFMHASIARADRVIMICSTRYVARADVGTGGVGYEKLIVSAALAAKTDTAKYMPVVRGNSSDQKLPLFLGHRLFLDFEADDKYSESLHQCLRDLSGLPQRDKPKLGAFAVPELLQSRKAQGQSEEEAPALTPQEIDALAWTMEGKTAWEIGAILGTSERKAALNVANAVDKLGADNKHAAVLKALRLGILR